MPTSVNISDELVAEARIKSKIFCRTNRILGQSWPHGRGKPGYSPAIIQDILTGKEQIKAVLGTPYIFGEGE